MPTVYCGACVFLYQQGGVWYCGCPGCYYNGKSVSTSDGKNCGYFKHK